MFGAGNEPNTVEEFYQRMPVGVDLYTYNEGEVINVNPSGIKSVNDNAWDEQWEVGTITIASGSNFEAEGMIRSKNYIKVIPGTTYKFVYTNVAKNYRYILLWC